MHRRSELIVFLAVLASGIAFIALGVTPNSLSTVAISLSGLYGAYRHRNPGNGAGGKNDQRQDGS
ncbi:hypothetical protein [Streptomyces sp. NBC_00035]|uniref:hypothetical protein n=1 Tax=Streptomyces sp. NBC_00035 TaxID=2903614 RepID=UPI0032507BCD